MLPSLARLTRAAEGVFIGEDIKNIGPNLGVYVRSVSRFTLLYMTLIDPFRKLIVYPSLLRSARARWEHVFGTS